MKGKMLILFLTFLGISQLNAETLLQIYPPSWFGIISGNKIKYNGFEKNENDDLTPATYNLPIEIRQTLATSSIADLMIVGGFSFYSENIVLRSINFSGGLTFGYGYNGIKSFFRNSNITIYPMYEYPLVILPWRTPNYRWKFALDISWELIQLKQDPDKISESQVSPISISVYIREIGIYAKDRVWFGIPDIGLVLGLLLF